VICFLFYLSFWLFNTIFWNIDFFGKTALFGLSLELYPIFCFCTSFAKRRSSVLFVAGVIVHVLLAMLVAMNLYSSAFCVLFAGAAYFTLAWFWMYSKLEN